MTMAARTWSPAAVPAPFGVVVSGGGGGGGGGCTNSRLDEPLTASRKRSSGGPSSPEQQHDHDDIEGRIRKALLCSSSSSSSSASIPTAPRQQQQAPPQRRQQNQQSAEVEAGEEDAVAASLEPIRDMLLRSPSTSEVPWRASCELMRQLVLLPSRATTPSSSSASGNAATTRSLLVIDVQNFLQQTAAAWWEEERRQAHGGISSRHSPKKQRGTPARMAAAAGDVETTTPASTTTPRHWILELLKIVVQPFFWDTGDGKNSNGETDQGESSGDEEESLLELLPLLVHTVISLAHDLEPNLLNACLSALFPHMPLRPSSASASPARQQRNKSKTSCQQELRPDRLLSWVKLALELRHVLRDADWAFIYRAIQSALAATAAVTTPASSISSLPRDDDEHDDGRLCDHSIPCKDLPGLAEATVTLCRVITDAYRANVGALTPASRAAEEEGIVIQPWLELIFRQLHAASSCGMATLSKVEMSIQTSLTTAPSTILTTWARFGSRQQQQEESDDDDEIPSWTRSNFVLLIHRASRQSGSQLVTRLVAEAFGGATSPASGTSRNSRGIEFDLNQLCWAQLVGLAFPEDGCDGDKNNHKTTRTTRTPNGDATGDKYLQRTFKGVSYAGGGCFCSEKEARIESLSHAGSMVFSTLFPGLVRDLITSTHQLEAMERSEAWLQAARDSLQRSRDTTNHQVDAIIFAAVVFVTVYAELPKSRSPIVRGMQEAFFAQLRARKMTHNLLVRVYIATISVVLSSSEPLYFSKDLDRLSTVFAEPILPLSLFLELSKALSSLPAVRQVLLTAAEKELNTSWDLTQWAGSAKNRRSKDPSSEHLKCGLSSLVTLISSNAWGELETKAWLLLSDVIVTCKPALPFATRSWLFEQLAEQVNDGDMDMLASLHILRACLCRLLHFLGTNESGQHAFSPEWALSSWHGVTQFSEDIVGLFQLVLLLLGDNADWSERSLCSWRDYLRLLLQNNFRDLRKSGEQGRASSTPKMPFTDNPDCDQELHASLYCFSFILQYILGAAEAFAPPPETVLKMVGSLEVQAIASLDTQLLSRWLNPPALRDNSLVVIDKSVLNLVSVGLCDTLAAFFLRSEWTCVDVRSPELIADDDLRNATLTVSLIYEAKRQLSSTIPAGELNNNLVHKGSHTATLCAVFRTYCVVTEEAVKRCIDEADATAFAYLDQILVTALGLCDDVYSALSEGLVTGSCFRSLADSAGRLLNCLCNEAASKRLIAFVDKVVGGGHATTAKIGPIGSTQEIDATVQSVRTRVLQLFAKCIPVPVFQLADEKSVQVLFALIDGFAQDVSAGMEGESGGLNYDLFDLFLDCITVCVESLEDHLRSSKNLALLCSAAALSMRVRDSLTSILCTYRLSVSTAIKKTISLSFYALPSLARFVTVQAQFGQDCSEIFKHWNASSVSLKSSLDLCSVVLERKSEKGLGYSPPWELTLGNLTIQAEDDSDMECSNALGSDRVQPVPAEISTCNLDENTMNEHCVQLDSERAWTWVFNATLQSMEFSWDDSFDAIQCKDMFASIDGQVHYVKHRKIEHTEVLGSILFLLDILTKRIDEESSSDNILSQAVFVLPLSTKTRLLALLDRIFIVLQKALKTITGFLRRPYSDQRARSFALAESSCCVFSWIDCSEDGSELTVAVRKWLKVERDVASCLSGIPGLGDASSLLRKLPQTVTRAEELECTLRSLLDELPGDRKSQKKKRRRKTKRGQEEANSSFSHINFLRSRADCSTSGNDEATRTNAHMFAAVSEKVESIEVSLQRFCEEEFDSDSGEEAGVVPSVEQREERRKRRAAAAAETGRHVRKERKKRHLRSRNQAVDRWLRADQIGDEIVEDDAYADLEDFLVPG